MNSVASPTVVIVGASHAAAEAIASLRKFGWLGGITLIGDEPGLPYHRPPLSKSYYKGEVVAEKLLIRPTSFYQKNDVCLMLGRRVESINRDANTLSLDGGEQVAYQYLILATGTRARKLPISGADLPSINYLRTKQDVDGIQSQLKAGSKLLIVGAGYIGLEVAASAVKQGVDVIVFEAMDRVLARVTSPQVSGFYQRLHKEEGVDIRLNAALQKFEQTSHGFQAVTADGELIPFDAAIVGIGVIPNSELAEDAGLACDNGILVNGFTQTDDQAIFAIGDCSNHHNILYNRRIRLESVPNAVDQAKVAAAKICGKGVVYDQLPWFWSDQYDVKLQTAGLLQGYDQVVTRGNAKSRKFAAFYLQQGVLIAIDALNSPAEFMLSKKLIQQKFSPDAAKLADPDVSLKVFIN
ncbi:MAG: 3-phenylpropionate/trans-cinnamate dioxygenase ferredoxin reductase subunit [Arenicella sp.]|jgi:3-phenylpropionate/trans-cinnamate dioxygenase ferredoxin reductase subunit